MPEQNEWTYTKNEDGTYSKEVRVKDSGGVDSYQIISEYLGCVKNEKRLLDELEKCRNHYAAIKEVAEAIISENSSSKPTLSMSDGETTSAGVTIDSVDDLRSSLRS